MSEENKVKELLENFESLYDQFSEHFNFEAKEFLELGEAFFKENVLPIVDMPLSALDYLKHRKG